jgi:hypothetical protein
MRDYESRNSCCPAGTFSTTARIFEVIEVMSALRDRVLHLRRSPEEACR